MFTKGADARKHIRGPVKKVIISAPATDPDATFVLGVNDKTYDPAKHHVVSNASCTTNCLAPVAKVLQDTFGISGTMTTIHSYTNDQKLLDLPHKDLRRARAAALNMIPEHDRRGQGAEPGDSRAEGQAGRLLDARADAERERRGRDGVRGKTGDGGSVNAALKAAANGPLKGILAIPKKSWCRCDFKGNSNSSIVDAGYTKVVGDKCVKVLSWYDNEWGYSCRVRDLIKLLASKLDWFVIRDSFSGESRVRTAPAERSVLSGSGGSDG